jgi:hypothetical protein
MMLTSLGERAWKWRITLAVAICSGACATDPIRERVKEGRYFEAAELCREGATATSARACEEARRGAIEARLANLERLRREGHPASDVVSLAELDPILRLAELKPLAADSPIARALADQLARVKDALSSESRALAEQPLAAEVYWEKRVPLLGHVPLREWLLAGVEETRKSGQRACFRLNAERPTDGPYRTALVHRYCAHFGEKAVGESLDHARADVFFQGKGLSPQQQDIVRQRLLRAIAQTPWSKSPAPVALQVTVDGTYESSQSDQTVVLHGQYTDYHLAYGIDTLMIVPQTVNYPYEARDHWRRYEANLSISVALPGGKPFALTFKKGESLRGRDHHVTFEPADVHPVHTTIPTDDQWLDMEFGAFAIDLGAALDGRWVQSYCNASTYSVEEAARCLLAGRTDEPILRTIAAFVGDDGKAVARLANGPPSAP